MINSNANLELEVSELPYLDINAMTEEEYESEIKRRIDEAKADRSVLIPWEKAIE